jgi:hypothetical protein
MLDSITIEKCGYSFDVIMEQDCHMSPPWLDFDGHGVIVDKGLFNHKKPSELKLGSYHFYDFRLSMQKALTESWSIPEDLKLQLEFKKGANLTKREIAHHAVMQDYKYLSDWCDDRWTFAGIRVKCGENEKSLWGVEYKYFVDIEQQSYLMSTIHDVIDELVYTVTKEQQEVEFWNMRDVVTCVL